MRQEVITRRTIGEVSKLTGISKRALQIYDEQGLLVPSRTDSEYRLYSDDDLVVLFLIKLLKQLGYKLKEIKQIMESPDFDVQASLDAQIKMLEQKKRELECQIMLAKEVSHLASGDDGPNTGEAICALFRHPEYAWLLSSSDDEDANEAYAYFRWLNDSYERIGESGLDELSDNYRQMLDESKEFGISSQVFANLTNQLAELRDAGISPDSDQATKCVADAYRTLDEAYDEDPFASLYLVGTYYGTGELTPPSLLAKMDEDTQREIESMQIYMAKAVLTFVDTLELTEERKKAIGELGN